MADLIIETSRAGANPVSGSRTLRWLIGIIVVLGALLRVADAGRPFDHRLSNAWRAADYMQISRNYYRGSLNILYPRVDWNADTPGYVEMEFPVIPWLAAVADRTLGYHENYMRLIAGACSLATLLLFGALARGNLPPLGAVLATAAFALNPLLVRLGDAMQPEPLMLLGCVAVAYALDRWRRNPSNLKLMLVALCLAGAVLAKAPAAAMGLVVLVIVLRQEGMGALRRPVNHLAALVAILPPLAWMIWSSQFWKQYGNSLGVSNESHWLAWRMFFPPEFLFGILKWETLAVMTPPGWLLVLAATKSKQPGMDLAWAWFGAVMAFYFVAGGTTGDDWASYYHCLSVPAACLLMGAGFAVVAAPAAQVPRRGRAHRQLLGAGLGVAAIGMLAYGCTLTLYRRDHHDDLMTMRKCAMQLVKLVPTDGRIVVRGGEATDEIGRPVAYNEPMFFAWMDRRGFNYPRDSVSLATLEQMKSRGGRYWIARADELDEIGIKEEADKRFRRLAGCPCGGYFLYDLTPDADKKGGVAARCISDSGSRH